MKTLFTYIAIFMDIMWVATVDHTVLTFYLIVISICCSSIVTKFVCVK
jgi:hypothetical protein